MISWFLMVIHYQCWVQDQRVRDEDQDQTVRDQDQDPQLKIEIRTSEIKIRYVRYQDQICPRLRSRSRDQHMFQSTKRHDRQHWILATSVIFRPTISGPGASAPQSRVFADWWTILKAFSFDILRNNNVDLELISSENSENRSSEIKIKTNTFEIKNKIEITDADLEIKIDLEIPNTVHYIVWGLHKQMFDRSPSVIFVLCDGVCSNRISWEVRRLWVCWCDLSFTIFMIWVGDWPISALYTINRILMIFFDVLEASADLSKEEWSVKIWSNHRSAKSQSTSLIKSSANYRSLS